MRRFEDHIPEDTEVIIPNGRSTPIARRNFLALKQGLDTSDAEGMAAPPVSVPRNASKGPKLSSKRKQSPTVKAPPTVKEVRKADAPIRPLPKEPNWSSFYSKDEFLIATN